MFYSARFRKEMNQRSTFAHHLSVAMTTEEDDTTKTTGGNSMTPSSSNDVAYYFQIAVLVIGVVGTAGNALILYALVVSKQYKKHLLIVNQNALDLFSSFFLMITYSVKLCKIYLTGTLGYWLCVFLLSENLIFWSVTGSIVNLAAITIDRYLKVVHRTCSSRWLRPFVIYSAMAFAWIVGIVVHNSSAFTTSTVINGACYNFVIFKSHVERQFAMIWYIISFYFLILVIFIFCYGRILVAVRRQASVMAAYSGRGPDTSQTQSNQLQTNVIKTMVLVSALYAITWLPLNIYHLVLAVDPHSTFIDIRYYLSVFSSFLYISANPFIYATKFDPVRKVLFRMIPCEKCVQPTDGSANSGTAGIQLTYRSGTHERPSSRDTGHRTQQQQQQQSRHQGPF